MSTSREVRAIDLFCGGGGSSWGAKNAGVRLVAAFDMWDIALKTYEENFPGVKLYSGDLMDHDPMMLRKELGRVDLILASPECTNHSPAKGNSPRCELSRETAFHVVRFAETLQPRWVIVENVVSMRNWIRYPDLVGDLNSLGYYCREQILDASDFGVPQTRRRLFLTCDRDAEPGLIKPTGSKKKSAKLIINPNGAYPYTPLRTESRAKATIERAERAISKLGEKKPFLIVYYGSDQAGGWQTVTRPLRTITTLDRFAYVKPTSLGHMMRMLQPEELKLAMGWPKTFRLSRGCRRDKIKIIGNAVSPKVMTAVIKSITRPLMPQRKEQAK